MGLLMSDRFTVTPAQLGEAAIVLRGAETELMAGSPSGVGGLSGGDLGSPELASALASFSQEAQAVVSALAGVVTAAASKLTASGDAYGQTDAAAFPAGQ
jgi:hypothetical protein